MDYDFVDKMNLHQATWLKMHLGIKIHYATEDDKLKLPTWQAGQQRAEVRIKELVTSKTEIKK